MYLCGYFCALNIEYGAFLRPGELSQTYNTLDTGISFCCKVYKEFGLHTFFLGPLSTFQAIYMGIAGKMFGH